MLTRDFLRALEAFRAYRRYPQWNLPITTNVIEAMANVLRQRVPTLNTPGSVQSWATALLRLRPRMVCNGPKNQPD